MAALPFASRDEFIDQRNRVLRSGAPITSPEHLKGRDRALTALKDALRSPGKHAFIYGFRGVGKTSLAQTAAYQLQSAGLKPIFISCEAQSTFSNICREIISRFLALNPLEQKSAVKGGFGVSLPWLGGINVSGERSTEKLVINIETVTDAIRYFSSLCELANVDIFVVIDEFDAVTNDEDHKKFASLIKALSDQNISMRLIFCGISENIESLFSAHASVARQVHPEAVERLGLQARIDIINDAEKSLAISVPAGFKYRISQISDGFPSFVHSICENIFACSYDEIVSLQNTIERAIVSTDAYTKGLDLAVSASQFSLRQTYAKALHRNGRSYEAVIWAVADDEFLEVNVDETWKNYDRICSQLRLQQNTRANMNTKLVQLASPNRGCILTKPRRSNYSFTEKIMRGYARLCAARAGVDLGPENPAAA